METSLLCMVGPQPPPRHGVSAVNEAVLALTKEMGLKVRCFNTSPVSLSRNLLVRLARLWPLARAVFGTWTAVRRHPGAVVYCSASGGYGILGDLPVVWLARKHGAQVVLHHNSFRYLNEPFVPMHWLTRVAGSETIHVMLSEGMDRVFRSRYSHVQKTLLVSNIAFIHLATPSETPPRPICRVIGHLSNLTAAKGVFDVVELAEWADREKLDFEFRIAGPFEDEKVKGEFCTRTCRLNNIRYFGPLYGAEKQTFLEELDAFVFPTHYRNEAEPLVLLEALSHGCPVISYDRGSIPAIVDEACGVLLPREAAFLPTASTTLLNWQADSHAHLNRCRAAREKSAKLLAEASIGRQRLLNILRGEEKDVP